jgi:hypothetical protein
VHVSYERQRVISIKTYSWIGGPCFTQRAHTKAYLTIKMLWGFLLKNNRLRGHKKIEGVSLIWLVACQF